MNKIKYFSSFINENEDNSRSIVVTIHENFIDDLDSIAKILSESGLSITNLYYELGTIIGIADDKTIKKIRGLKQVESVSDEKIAKII
jgi:hypothetical protein